MMKRLERMVSFAAIGMVLLFVLSLQANAATVVYSNFGPNFGSNSGGGQGSCVSGNATLNCGPLTQRWIAAPFTSGGSFDLTQIDLALGFLSGTNGAIIDLVGNSGGFPGTNVLESWTVLNIPAIPDFTPSTVVTLISPGGVSLNSGSGYWLVAKGVANDTLDYWLGSPLINSRGSAGSLDQGASWAYHPESSVAFDVLGNPAVTPEPSSMALIGAAILCLGLIRKRVRRTVTSSASLLQ